MKKLYYALVKALHPDLHPNQPEQDQQLWQQVQDAYTFADLKKLRALMKVVTTEAPAPDSPTAMDQLQNQRESLQNHLRRLRSEIDRLQAELPFSMKPQLVSETWIERRRAEIDTECAALTNLRIQLEKHLDVLNSAPIDGKVTSLN